MEETSTPQSQNNLGIPLVIGALVILGILAFAFMRNNETTSENTTPTPMPTNIETDRTMDEAEEDFIADDDEIPSEEVEGVMDESEQASGEVKTFTMEAGAFYYTPNVVQVKKGDTVKITMSGKDMMHNFVIDELNVTSETVREGETTEIEFVANQAGEFEFYCGIGQHRANGQTGTLVVTE